MIKQHFPFAGLVAAALPLALGNGSLFIMTLAAIIGAMPLVYGRDVDQVVRATVARRNDRR
ncbi:MAG TPA: hypothetical protein VMK32_08760 [Burkholderiaceae bacterium]|nr:hypothetical protein [Burkholderiaceae bacterium]